MGWCHGIWNYIYPVAFVLDSRTGPWGWTHIMRTDVHLARHGPPPPPPHTHTHMHPHHLLILPGPSFPRPPARSAGGRRDPPRLPPTPEVHTLPPPTPLSIMIWPPDLAIACYNIWLTDLRPECSNWTRTPGTNVNYISLAEITLFFPWTSIRYTLDLAATMHVRGVRMHTLNSKEYTRSPTQLS